MRKFSPEEKELIVNTPITNSCFEKWKDYEYEEIKVDCDATCIYKVYPTSCFESLVRECEAIRWKYLETKNEHYFDILVRLLPNSYKVVKL